MVKDKKVLPHLSSYANDPERIECRFVKHFVQRKKQRKQQAFL